MKTRSSNNFRNSWRLQAVAKQHNCYDLRTPLLRSRRKTSADTTEAKHIWEKEKKIDAHQLGWVFSRARSNRRHAHKHGVGVTVPDFLWELSIGDQKAGDVVGVEETDEAVDFRVHDGLAHQRQSAVFDFQALPVALRFHSRDTWGSGDRIAVGTFDLTKSYSWKGPTRKKDAYDELWRYNRTTKLWVCRSKQSEKKKIKKINHQRCLTLQRPLLGMGLKPCATLCALAWDLISSVWHRPCST